MFGQEVARHIRQISLGELDISEELLYREYPPPAGISFVSVFDIIEWPMAILISCGQLPLPIRSMNG
jgi:hypothetical protein